MNLTTLIENKSKEFDNKFDIKKIINTIDTNGTIEIEHSVTKEQLDFLSTAIQEGYELAIKDVEKELFEIPYLCPFCVNRQSNEGECLCDCHTSEEHIEAYQKQLKETLQSLLKEEKL